jgi:hypothetical protein
MSSEKVKEILICASRRRMLVGSRRRTRGSGADEGVRPTVQAGSSFVLC